MSWDRVSEWEIEERPHDVVLTLRGDGAATPLVITGWSVDELETVMRSVTAPAIQKERVPADDVAVAAVQLAEAAPIAEPAVAEPHVGEPDAGEPQAEESPDGGPQAEGSPAPVASRRARRRDRHRRVGAKAMVTIGLLLVLVAAVTLVLLQSAGVIDWSFLGPTA